MRYGLCAIALIGCSVAAASWSTYDQGRVLEAFQKQDAASMAFLTRQLKDASHTAVDWRDCFAVLFENEPPSEGILRFLATQAQTAGDDAQPVWRATAAYVAAGLQAAFMQETPHIPSMDMLLAWLEQQRSGFASADTALREGLATLTKAPLPLTRWLSAPPNQEPMLPEARAAMQTCLTLARFIPAEKLNGWLQMPNEVYRFFSETYVFAFDNGALTSTHWASLRSLFQALPAGLHDVRLVLFPESVGAENDELGLRHPGAVLHLPIEPMSLMSDPEAFFPSVGPQSAPSFTLHAVEALLYEVQQTQFTKRPQLAAQRNAILQAAGENPGCYARPFVPPSHYLQQPDSLLPLTGVLWALNTPKAFEVGAQRFSTQGGAVLDTLLLLADMLSDGDVTTPVLSIANNGLVRVQRASLVRDTAAENQGAPLRGITLAGHTWRVERNSFGEVVNYSSD